VIRLFAYLLMLLMLLLGEMSAYVQNVSAAGPAPQSCSMEPAGIYVGGSLDKAIEGLRELIKSNPFLPDCHIRLGYLLLKKDSNDEAIREFEKALQLVPRSHRAKIGKGIALAHKGDLKAAETIFKDALILNPDPMKVYYELGLVYEKMGYLPKALSEFKEGISRYEQGRK
jgi:tetratricopeptide (TPR) repeat protein